MPDLDVVTVVAATVAAFGLSGAWYAVLGDQLAPAPEPVPTWTYGVELLRNLAVATVVAGLVAQTGTDDWTGGLWLGLALWVGLPLVQWTGAIVHEKTPLRPAAVHAGDWLLKLPAVAVIAAVWA